jgi:4-aminobutyrate aminotransferase
LVSTVNHLAALAIPGSYVLEFTPPLTLSESEVAEVLAIIDQALTDASKGLVSDAEVAPFIMW